MQSTQTPIMMTSNAVLQNITLDYLNQINRNAPPPPLQIEADLLTQAELQFSMLNAQRTAGTKWKAPKRLEPVQIAYIIKELYPVCTICTGGEGSDESYDLLVIYQDDGPRRGIYVSDDKTFRSLMRQYNFTLKDHEFQEAMTTLHDIVPRRTRCTEKNLIAVNNGIFDYDTKTLMDFTPDYVFLSKSRVDYRANAVNPVIHNPDDNTDWDVESWMKELSDDPEIVNLLWQILGAIIRPLVPWNKSAWFYSESGNNGKGTLCELMRQLVGSGSYASVPLADMGKDFMLEPLTRASCIIVDENDVGTFIDKAANLKAIVTNDVLPINRKFKTPIAYQFYGFMVQCLNEMPKVKDKSDSFFRRQLFIPFEKCFTGKERKYIKSDYLHRQEVLEYVMCRVLNMDYYSLSEPEACKLALEEYKEYNDPVRQFMEEILPLARWDMLPFTMLYAMYQTWFKRNVPSGKIQSRNTFINDVITAISNDTEWVCPDKKRQFYGSGKMECCEPLLGMFDLKDWMNPKFANVAAASEKDRCTPMAGQYARTRFRGILRISALPQGTDEDEILSNDEPTETTEDGNNDN